MSNRNRTAGHNYERQIVSELKEMGFEAVTSRSESKNMDDKGVDIITSAPFHIQCKNQTTLVDYVKILLSEKLPLDKPLIIFGKKTKKANTKFITQGEFVILKKDEFYKIINNAK